MNPSGFNDCEQIKSFYTLYEVHEVALLCCGVSTDQLESHINSSHKTELKGVWANPYISCLEPRCKVIHEAIMKDELKVCRSMGGDSWFNSADHVAPESRRLKREDLRNWIIKNSPNDKPAFLFDEIERKTHTSINADTFRALQADRDALETELRRAKKLTNDKTNEIEQLKTENESIKNCINKMRDSEKTLSEKEERKYLNIIGALVNLILSKSPNQQRYSIFDSQGAIISALLGHYSSKQGISSSTLENKFSAANKSLKEY